MKLVGSSLCVGLERLFKCMANSVEKQVVWDVFFGFMRAFFAMKIPFYGLLVLQLKL